MKPDLPTRLAIAAAKTYVRTPLWLRPSLVGATLVLAILCLRVPFALADERGQRLAEMPIAFGAAAGAAALGGLGFTLSRPLRTRLGRLGGVLSGIVILWLYLGALALASPYVFHNPVDLSHGVALPAAMATALGAVAGLVWFRGEGFAEGARERASVEFLVVPLDEDMEDGREGLVLAGFTVPGRIEELFSVLERVLEIEGSARSLEEAKSALRREGVHSMELRALPSVPLFLSAKLPGFLRFEILMHEERMALAQDLAQALGRLTVDPLTHAA